MFPKNKVNLIYRLLCLICFIVVIIMINSLKSLIVLFIAYSILALLERSFRNIELIIISLLLLGLSYLLGYYWIFKVILLIDYAFYFIDSSYYEEEDELIDKEDYIRFKKSNKKKGSNNITAIYLTIHLVILFVAILVG